MRYLAGQCGVRQFIDIGTGLPAPDNTHEIAQVIAPESRIVYVDNDPLVLVHARALLTSHPTGACDYIDADLQDTTRILSQAADTLDFTKPVAVLMLAVLHFVADADDPAAIVATFTHALAPGSYVVISHLTADFATEGVQVYTKLVPSPLAARSHAQVHALFGRLPVVAPGVVPVTEWRAEAAGSTPPPADLYAGVGKVMTGRM